VSDTARPLTPKQSRFVELYIVSLNATQAYKDAYGCSEEAALRSGPRLLGNVGVGRAIATAKAARAERTAVTQDYVLANLTEVVERCLQRAPVMVRQGREMVQLKDDEDRDVWQFDARGAVASLNLLGKHLAMFTDRQELSGPFGGPVSVAVTHEIIDPANA
jgi:phage terminase small subunit